MKKSLIMLFALALTLGASAQPKIGGGFRGGGGVHYIRPHVTVIAPYAYTSPYFGLGLGYGYNPFYNPFYRPRYYGRPSGLELQIEDIKNDYNYQISTVKHDKSIPKSERKQKVRDLKHERDDAINQAKRDYYKIPDRQS